MEVVRDLFLSDGWECVEDLVGGDSDSNPVFVRMRFTLGNNQSLPWQINDRQYAYDFYINTFAAEARYQFGNSSAPGISWHKSREGFTVPIFLFDQREWCDCSLRPVIHVLWVRLAYMPWTNGRRLHLTSEWMPVLDEPARQAWFDGQRNFHTAVQDGFPETSRSSFLFESICKYSDWLEDNKSVVAKCLRNLCNQPGAPYYNNLIFLSDAPGRCTWMDGPSEVTWHFEKAVNDRSAITAREAKWHEWHTDRIMFGPGLNGCKPGQLAVVEEDRCEIVRCLETYAVFGDFTLTRMPYDRQRVDTWRDEVGNYNASTCRRIFYIPLELSVFNQLVNQERLLYQRDPSNRELIDEVEKALQDLQCNYMGAMGERDQLEDPQGLIQIWPMRLTDPDNIRSGLIPAGAEWRPHFSKRPSSLVKSRKRARDLLEKYNCLCDDFKEFHRCVDKCTCTSYLKNVDKFSVYRNTMNLESIMSDEQRSVLTRVWHVLKELKRADSLEFKRLKAGK